MRRAALFCPGRGAYTKRARRSLPAPDFLLDGARLFASIVVRRRDRFVGMAVATDVDGFAVDANPDRFFNPVSIQFHRNFPAAIPVLVYRPPHAR